MQAYCFHMNEMFANCSEEDEIYPLITEGIAEARQADCENILTYMSKRTVSTEFKTPTGFPRLSLD